MESEHTEYEIIDANKASHKLFVDLNRTYFASLFFLSRVWASLSVSKFQVVPKHCPNVIFLLFDVFRSFLSSDNKTFRRIYVQILLKEIKKEDHWIQCLPSFISCREQKDSCVACLEHAFFCKIKMFTEKSTE